MTDTLSIFQAAKERFRVVGILGMSLSGTSRFLTTLWNRPLLTSIQQVGMGEKLKNAILADHSLVLDIAEYFQSRSPFVLDASNLFAKDTEQILKNIILADDTKAAELIEKFSNITAEASLAEVATKLNLAVEKNQALIKRMNVPFFVELPVVTNLNYYDYVDEIVLVTRPTIYNDSAWYVNIASQTCAQANQYDVCFDNAGEAVKLLAAEDAVFNKCVSALTPVKIIDNVGTEQEFVEKIFAFIDLETANLMNPYNNLR